MKQEIHPKPPNETSPNHNKKYKQYWCPYCGRWSYTKENEALGIKVLSCCGVSLRDYYVKKENHLWNEDV